MKRRDFLKGLSLTPMVVALPPLTDEPEPEEDEEEVPTTSPSVSGAWGPW